MKSNRSFKQQIPEEKEVMQRKEDGRVYGNGLIVLGKKYNL